MKILIVDDNKQNLLLLEAMLKGGGHAVVSAGNGIIALEILGKEKIDMIISDILMPGMDGFKLCVKCKEDEKLRAIPFIFISSSYTEAKDEEFGKSLGADAFVIRPIEPEEFIKKISELFIKKKEEKEAAPVKLSQKDISFLEKYSERLARQLERKIAVLEKTIAERKRMAEAMGKSEAKFKSIFDHATDGILLADKETKKFIDGNREICDLLGYTLDEIKNLGVMEIHPKEDLPHVLDQFEKQAKGEITVTTLPVKRKDGSVFYADVSSGPVELAGKQYLIGIFRDITERRRAEKEIKESEYQYHTLFEHAPIAITLIDNSGVITDCNAGTERLTGYARDQIIGKRFDKLMTLNPRDLPRLREHHEKLARGEAVESYELETIKKDGSRQLLNIVNSLLTKENKVIGIQIFATDITERKRAEEAIKERINELEVYAKATVGRELKMIELEKDVNTLLNELNRPPKYK
ncbi:MAG: PAS domain S-box protein [Candidatus Omnitrophica bacterium]|nr:PAS domain S-box protein [Candidatus Omnitrophota bacterium]